MGNTNTRKAELNSDRTLVLASTTSLLVLVLLSSAAYPALLQICSISWFNFPRGFISAFTCKLGLFSGQMLWISSSDDPLIRLPDMPILK